MDEREKSLQVVEEVSFLKRIFNFFKSIFKTNNTNYFIEDKNVIGTVKFKIPYIGLPTVWLNEL